LTQPPGANWKRPLTSTTSSLRVLGTEFLDVIEAALEDLLAFMESRPVLLGQTRKLVLRRFPYSVMYWTDGEVIAVYAIAHQSRRPGYWRDRV